MRLTGVVWQLNYVACTVAYDIKTTNRVAQTVVGQGTGRHCQN